MSQRAWETAMGMRGYAGSPAQREDREERLMRIRQHFVPRDPKAHEQGKEPDTCAQCGHPFMEHINSVCPGQLGRGLRPKLKSTRP